MLLKNGEELEVREALESDAEELSKYMNAVGGQSGNLLFGAGGFGSAAAAKGMIAGFAEESNSAMLLGHINGVLASNAMLMGYQRERISHRASIAMSVDARFWGLGIGKIMLVCLIEYGKMHGTEVFELSVRADNESAIGLYEKLGFKRVGFYEKFFKIDGEYFDAYNMNLYI